MTEETILTNARVVLPDAVLDDATVVVRDGRVAAVEHGRTTAAGAIDLDGDLLLPGLVEMHTDNLEKHFEPRPGVIWPNAVGAVLAHDTQIAGAGITTVFDAISVGAYDTKEARRHLLAESISAVKHAQGHGLLRAEHLFHLRCEVSDPCVIEMFEPYAADPLVRLVSVMDHTPGQRQFTDLAKYAKLATDGTWTPAELERVVAEKRALQERYAVDHRTAVVALVREHGRVLASHDDETEVHVAEAVSDGCTIAEFPVTEDAAGLAVKHGLATVMGAPNVVRGGSHSGNVSALALAARGLLTGLSSDYVPSSLLQAAFLLYEKTAMTLPQAVATVSGNVAAMVGLDDRGAIAEGKRADLIWVHHAEHTPVVRQVWRAGRRVC